MKRKRQFNEGWCDVVQWRKPLKRFRQRTCPNEQPTVETAGYNHFVPSGL
ncbi:hypothetical protein ACX8XN_03960 [Calditrichota bacterium GD2]